MKDLARYPSQHLPAMTARMNTGVLRAKLHVNQPGDAFQQAADRLAANIRLSPYSHKAGEQACGAVQRRASESRDGLQEAPSVVGEVLQSTGQPLEASTRRLFENRLGHDFSRVRVHTDTRASESARAVSALAYTVGKDIVFGAGQYAPSTPQGRRLLAHELVHVVQQGGRSYRPGTPLRVTGPNGALEHQAKAAARYPGQPAGLIPGSGPTAISLQRAVEVPASPTVGVKTTTDDSCAGWFSDHESLTKRAAEHYVRTELKGNRGGVERIECDLFDANRAYACTAHFSDGTPIRVIVRKDTIIVSVAPINSMYPPPDRPLCWYDYACVGPNRELVLTKRKCQSAKPTAGTSPASGGRGPNP